MVFIPKKKAAKQRIVDIGSIMGHSRVSGRIGLEIEVEGKRLIHPNNWSPALSEYWSYHKDGSLRGAENAEYVLKKPFDEPDVVKAVNLLWSTLIANKAVIDDSNRTSVHVHLNMQDFYLNQVVSFAVLYFCFEELLTEWCGEHRVGNLFCLRAVDAPGILTHLRNFVIRNGSYDFPDGLHYAGFNLQALNKFGSIEIRTLRGVTDFDLILDWVKILGRLHDRAKTIADPRTILAKFSEMGPVGFYWEILGNDFGTKLLPSGGSGSGPLFTVEESLLNGIRRVQDIAYCRDWSTFAPLKVSYDPFGRAEIEGVPPDKTSFVFMKLAGGGLDDEALAAIVSEPAGSPKVNTSYAVVKKGPVLMSEYDVINHVNTFNNMLAQGPQVLTTDDPDMEEDEYDLEPDYDDDEFQLPEEE